MLSSTRLLSKSMNNENPKIPVTQSPDEWSRWPIVGWQYGGDTSSWAIIGRVDESTVGYSYTLKRSGDQSPSVTTSFPPVMRANKVNDRLRSERHDFLNLCNFDLDPIINLLLDNKLITDDTFYKFYHCTDYKDFIKSVEKEKHVSFAGISKEGAWLCIENNRYTILKILEDGNILPKGVTDEYKQFSENVTCGHNPNEVKSLNEKERPLSLKK